MVHRLIHNLKFSAISRVVVALAALAGSTRAFAQTCPACYNNAASQAPGLLQALRTGVLVMMLPSLAMFVVIYVVLYTRRNSFRGEADEATPFERESPARATPPVTPPSERRRISL